MPKQFLPLELIHGHPEVLRGLICVEGCVGNKTHQTVNDDEV